MTSTDAVFSEATAHPQVRAVPLAHLSIELGHLYLDDFVQGPERLRQHFHQVRPWAQAARQARAELLGGRTARVSTCFLVDDYFTPFSSPAELVPELVRAASDSGLQIDYLARESACAEADGVELARLVQGRLVAEPPPGTNGSRPPATKTGWLCNGRRSPSTDPGAGTSTGAAMGPVRPWTPPAESAAYRHSIFLDAQLWDDHDGRRTWSCHFLATVWQLLRLGLLRDLGEPVAEPQPWDRPYPDDWARLPAVVQLNPDAAPFRAYRTFSVLAPRFLPTEHAVRTILSQVAVEAAVLEQVARRSRDERLRLPAELVDRIDYVFAGETAGVDDGQAS